MDQIWISGDHFDCLSAIIPFDIGGLIAGAARMPLYNFLPELWIGNFPSIYSGLCGMGIRGFSALDYGG